MTVRTLLEAILLALLLLSCWIGVLGMLRMREPTQSLHYLGLPACVGSPLLAVAVFLATGNSGAAWKMLLIVGLLLFANAVVTHAITRAFRTREIGPWQPQPGDPFEFTHILPNSGRAGQEPTHDLGRRGILLLLAVSGAVVVTTRDTTEQVITLSFYGLVTALMFFFFQAPDVALSQITVGAVALPLMVMLAISRMRAREALKDNEQGNEQGKGQGKEQGDD